jgi:hypothetical protein
MLGSYTITILQKSSDHILLNSPVGSVSLTEESSKQTFKFGPAASSQGYEKRSPFNSP